MESLPARQPALPRSQKLEPEWRERFCFAQKGRRKKIKNELDVILKKEHLLYEYDLLSIMQDRSLASDDELPDTGIGFEREKRISAIHVANPYDGTCSSSLLMMDTAGMIEFTEISYKNSHDQGTKLTEKFNIYDK